MPPPTFAHTPTWTWGSAWRSPPPGSPPTAQWSWRQPSTAAWAPGPWRGQQGAQAGGADSSGPHTQTPPTALPVPRAQGAQADVGWGRRAGDGGWGGVGSGARTHPSPSAGPGTLGRCRGACWGSVFTRHPTTHTQAFVSFLFLYLKQTSVHYVQVRLLDGWAGRGPSWVGAQCWLKGVRGVLGPTWPAGRLLHSCYPAHCLEAAPSPAHLTASLGSDLPAPRWREEASSYSKINKCLAWGLTTPPSATSQTGPESRAHPGEGQEYRAACVTPWPGGWRAELGRAEARGSGPQVKAEQGEGSEAQGRASLWHNEERGAGGGLKPLVLGLPAEAWQMNTGARGGAGPPPDSGLLSCVLEPAPGGQQSVSVLKESWAWQRTGRPSWGRHPAPSTPQD